MRDRRRLAMGLLVAGVAAGAVLTAGRQPSPAPQLSLRVPVPPAVVPMAGQRWLSYELHVENRGAAAVTLTSVEIATDTAPSSPLATFEGAALQRRLDVPSAPQHPFDVAPGGQRVIYIDVALPTGSQPAHLRHHVRVTAGTIVGGIAGGIPGIPVDTTPPVVLGPPLAEGPWAAVHSPDWERGHRRVFYTVDGATRLPGRFTIDFVRVDDTGGTASGNRDLVVNALGYGTAVRAVADATVAAVRDDMPEPARLSGRVKHPQQDAAGNYVSLDLGHGRFAVYEHLKPESVRVRVGDRVRRGDVIAELGFSGDSVEPHLHLHVGDSANPLGAEGRPFVFERFEVLGRYADIAALGTARWQPDGAGTRRHERPAPNAVVDFGWTGLWPDRLPFVDEADRCDGFATFRQALLDTLDRRDLDGLMTHVADELRLTFEEPTARERFRQLILDDDDYRQELWSDLPTVLRMGGGCEAPDTFLAPYVTSHGNGLGFDYLAVVGDGVALRSAAEPDSPVIGRLSRAIVRITDHWSVSNPWTAVAVSDGRHGYVSRRFLRSPSDMRASFTRIGGVWRLTAWIGGD